MPDNAPQPRIGASRWQYLPALDGIRAFAVIAVVCFHYWPAVVAGGYVGVDLFFVISGYLITAMMLVEYDGTARVNLGAFWGRRVRRLVPAVVVLIAVCSLVVTAIGAGSARTLLDSVGALTWTTNWVELWFSGSRMWALNSRSVLDHLWSLAIEEQFYLVWPIVVWGLLAAVKSKRAQLAVLMALAATSIAVMAAVAPGDAYFRTDARAFELIFGAILAFVRPSGSSRLRGAAGGVGLVGVAAFLPFRMNDAFMFPVGFVLLALASVAIVYAAAEPPRWLNVAASWPPLRLIGQTSYGIYLWHIPVLRVLSPGRTGLAGFALTATRLIVLAALVVVSYRFVETPARRGTGWLSGRRLGLGYVVAVLCLLPLVPSWTRDVQGQWDFELAQPKARQGTPRVLVLGDLLGATAGLGIKSDKEFTTWAPAADPKRQQDRGCHFVSDSVVLVGGKPLSADPDCRHWEQRWRHAVTAFDPAIVVVGAGVWDTMELRRGGVILDGPALSAAYDDAVRRQLAAVAGAGRRIVVIRIDDWSKLVTTEQRSLTGHASAAAAYNKALYAAVANRADISVIRVAGAPSWADLISDASSVWPGALR